MLGGKAMNKNMTLAEIKEIVNKASLPLRPRPVIIPESVKKQDRIYMSIENTKRDLNIP